MSNVDTIRTELYAIEGEFVDKLSSADKADPALRAEAIARINAVFKYATIKGRGRFLDAMKTGDHKKANIVYQTCLKEGGAEEECWDKGQQAFPTFRPLFDAWPSTNSVEGWWSAPLKHLIGTYDPKNQPAGELTGWKDELRKTAPGLAGAVDVAEDVGEVVDDIGQSVGEALEPEPDGFPWWKVGTGVAASVLVGALAYRIASK